MYPARTQYTLCTTPAQFRACHAFFRAESQHPLFAEDNGATQEYVLESIGAPTVQAVRDGKVIGVMATKRVPQGIVASPCHVSYDIKNAIPTIIRLIDAYEAALRPIAEQYMVVMPNFKPVSARIWEELKGATLLGQVLNDRYNIYQVRIP